MVESNKKRQNSLHVSQFLMCCMNGANAIYFFVFSFSSLLAVKWLFLNASTNSLFCMRKLFFSTFCFSFSLHFLIALWIKWKKAFFFHFHSIILSNILYIICKWRRNNFTFHPLHKFVTFSAFFHNNFFFVLVCCCSRVSRRIFSINKTK